MSTTVFGIIYRGGYLPFPPLFLQQFLLRLRNNCFLNRWCCWEFGEVHFEQKYWSEKVCGWVGCVPQKLMRMKLVSIFLIKFKLDRAYNTIQVFANAIKMKLLKLCHLYLIELFLSSGYNCNKNKTCKTESSYSRP